jgi:hypothetical protein
MASSCQLLALRMSPVMLHQHRSGMSYLRYVAIYKQFQDEFGMVLYRKPFESELM